MSLTDPIHVEAATLAGPHRTKLLRAPHAERAKMRRELLIRLRHDMAAVRVSMAENLFARHKLLYTAFRDALDAATDTTAVKAHA
jgi:hypothetical protein